MGRYLERMPFAFKRLADAERDGDRIYGVLKDSARAVMGALSRYMLRLQRGKQKPIVVRMPMLESIQKQSN